jgi:hypothetical protein
MVADIISLHLSFDLQDPSSPYNNDTLRALGCLTKLGVCTTAAQDAFSFQFCGFLALRLIMLHPGNCTWSLHSLRG